MKQQFQQMSIEMAQARARLKELISSLPDSAEGVTPLGSNCCSVPFSLLAKHGGNLSARYWLTKESKDALFSILNSNKSADSMMKTIEDVLATGVIKQPAGTLTLPPNVIKALKEAWEAV